MAPSDRLPTKGWTFSATSPAAQRLNRWGLYVLLASIGMIFGAVLLGYLVIRYKDDQLPAMHIPAILWLSTFFVLLGGRLLDTSLHAIRREHRRRFRWELVAAFLLGAAFCTTQSFGLAVLLHDHEQTVAEFAARRAKQAQEEEEKESRFLVPEAGQWSAVSEDLAGQNPTPPTPANIAARISVEDRPLEGLIFVIVAAHILHFACGMIALAIVTWRGLKGRYDHEYHGGLHLCAIYWRFLDVVWVILFATFLLTA